MIELHKNPVWILSGPRTGSCFVSEVLNETKIFKPIFSEWFHFKKINKIFCDEKLLSPFDYKWPKFAKVHEDHFEKIKQMFPLLKIEEVIPNLKFIHLRRGNLIKQVISEFFARKTNVYFVKNKKELTEYQELKVDYDEKIMLCYYKKAIIRFNSWKPLLTKDNHINIFYEELIDNSKEIFLKIFDFIGIIPPNNLNIEATLITSHPLKEEYEKKFTDFLIKNNHIIFNNMKK